MFDYNVTYTYEMLVNDLALMHEVEFQYDGKQYSLSHGEEGFFLTEYYDKTQTFASYEELLQKGRICEKTLKEIWGLVEITAFF